MNDESPSSTPGRNSEEAERRAGLPERLWKWIDRRTGADRILRHSLDEPIPGGARFAYVFGSALLFIFLSQCVTGICLALYYAPSPMTAHASVAYIVKEVAAGSFLRSLHSYGSSAMLVVLLLHFLQTLLYGSYKGRRELLWISGCTLALLVLGMAFTGYLLSWDQSAYSAGSVGTDIVGQVPFIGESLRLLLRGGAMMGALTLSRFYVLHILIIPGLIISLIAGHIALFRKAGAAGPANEDPITPHLPAETFYPKQVLIDMTFVLLVMGVLGMLAHFVPVMLGLQADPANTRYLPRPEWYYLPMFQWLKYWQGGRTVIGVFIIPVVLLGLLFSLPFMDRGRERRPWRRPIPVIGVLIVLISLVWLGMTSRLDDARDPLVAAQLAEQKNQESVYFYTAFQPYTAAAPSAGGLSTSLGASAAMGKGIFDSHGCSGCHGQSGGGAVGPALTHISSQYSPAQLTALLKAPTAKMKAAGMVPLTLNAAEMTSLVSYLASLGGTSAASASTPSTSASSSPAPANAQPGAPAGPAKAGTGKPAANATNAPGKGIFDSHGCSGCHGQTGGGGVGPALTHISSQYPPAQLTALLKAPTAKMKAAGMVALTLNAADMKALVSYLASLGGTSAAPAATPSTSASSSPAPASAQPAATAGPAKAGTATPAADASAAPGKGIFDSHGCSGCHGQSGGGAVGPALTHISSQYPPAQLTALLKAPTAKMRAAGMVPLTLKAADMKALVAYLASLGGTSAATAATPSASRPSSPAPAKAQPAATAGPSKAPKTPTAPAAAASKPAQPPSRPQAEPSQAGASRASANPSDQHGKSIFSANGCASCHGSGGVGTSRAPALTKFSQTTPAALTSVLQHPTKKMQAGGMPPIKLTATDMTALVAYLRSLAAPADAQPAAETPSPGAPSSTVSPGASNQTAKSATPPPMNKLESHGKLIFQAHGCADCHGTGGIGGTAAAPALAGTGASFAPALITTMLQHPTARMHAGGMPPVSLSTNELKALAAYISRISASKDNPQ